MDSDPCTPEQCSVSHAALVRAARVCGTISAHVTLASLSSLAAQVGPATTASTEPVQYFALKNSVPLVAFRATAIDLTRGVGGVPVEEGGVFDPYFSRVCPTDGMFAAAVYKGIEKFGWDQFAVLVEASEYGRLFLQALQQEHEEAGNPRIVTAEASYEPGSDSSVDAALREVRATGSRVIVLIADGAGAAHLLDRAAASDMTGVGWTWVGAEWVQEGTWLQPISAEPGSVTAREASARVAKAMEGAIGVMPDTGALHSFAGGNFSTLRPAFLQQYLAPNGVPEPPGPPHFRPPTAAGCPALQQVPFSVGVRPDEYLPYLHDALWLIANAAADKLQCTNSTAGMGATGCLDVNVTSRGLGELMLGGTTRTSPITGSAISFSHRHDRYDVGLHLVNVQSGGKVVQAGQWRVQGPESAQASGQSLTAGRWVSWRPQDIVWAGGRTNIPSDRAVLPVHVEAAVFVAVIVGVVLSMVGGAVLETYHVHVLPESGLTVLLGMCMGGALLALGEQHSHLARFDETVFSLVFLPIIIFESGFALDKHPFFSQLGSILTFACAGTLISAFTIGGLLFSASQNGVIPGLSFPECMCFAALISAVDPVAILATFSSLRVDPSLNALVYGEAVINDAVAVVLFRAFSAFIVLEATPARVGEAAGSFIGILLGSVLLGGAVGLLATITFRYRPLVAQLASKEPSPAVHGVVQASLLLLFSYLAYALAEAAGISGIVASLFAGIAMNHYTQKALDRRGRETSNRAFRMLAFIAETVVFFQVGMNVVLYVRELHWALISITLCLCLVARALNVFPLAALLNCGRKAPIPGKYQLVMWHAGLRGAIAYATSIAFPSQHRDIIISTTSVVILFTIFLQGGSITHLLGCIGVQTGVDPEEAAQMRASRLAMTHQAEQESWVKAGLARADRALRACLYHPSVREGDSPLPLDSASQPPAEAGAEEEAGGEAVPLTGGPGALDGQEGGLDMGPLDGVGAGEVELVPMEGATASEGSAASEAGSQGDDDAEQVQV